VLKIEAAQERLPEPVDVGRGVAGDRPPQPDRFRVASARQMVDLQADDRRGCSRSQELAIAVP
jgi:hypothetical protein